MSRRLASIIAVALALLVPLLVAAFRSGASKPAPPKTMAIADVPLLYETGRHVARDLEREVLAAQHVQHAGARREAEGVEQRGVDVGFWRAVGPGYTKFGIECLLADEPAGAEEIARRARGTPRIANALLRRVRDFAQIKGNGTIDDPIVEYSLNALNVDAHGLDEMDNRILSIIIDKFKGGPVGINTIATAAGEEAGTIEEVYEPFLIMEGFLTRTPRGREITEKAYKHLGKKRPGPSGSLFEEM